MFFKVQGALKCNNFLELKWEVQKKGEVSSARASLEGFLLLGLANYNSFNT